MYRGCGSHRRLTYIEGRRGEGEESIRDIHVMSFESVNKRCWEQVKASINAAAERKQVPGCKPGGILNAIL